MKQNVAPTSLSIKIITLLILLMTIGMFIGTLYEPRLLWAGTVLAVVVVLCYLSAPVAYEINGDQLLIITRIGNKTFGPNSTPSMRYLRVQPVRKRLAARRATAGLAVANSREHNNADSRFLAGPKGAPQIGQCRVAVLVKGMPFPADCALPWPIWDALHPKISH